MTTVESPFAQLKIVSLVRFQRGNALRMSRGQFHTFLFLPAAHFGSAVTCLSGVFALCLSFLFCSARDLKPFTFPNCLYCPHLLTCIDVFIILCKMCAHTVYSISGRHSRSSEYEFGIKNTLLHTLP